MMVWFGFLEFQEAEHLDAANLSEKIISCLKYGPEYKENLVGQGYDGSAVMNGRCSGIQTRVKEVANYAFCVDCSTLFESCHCFFLCAGKTVCVHVRLIQCVHNKWLDVQKEMFNGAPWELQKLTN